MSSTTTMKKNQRDSERRRRLQRRRRGNASTRPPPRACGGAGGSSGNGGHKRSASSSKVSDKLEALKSLIPSPEGEILKADELFEQTADYIVRLRTQVSILQTLIEFYGSSESDNGVAVS